MFHIDSRPLPQDRHVCVIYLSQAGKDLDADGRVVEADPSPASEAAEALNRLLCDRLFPRRADAPHGQSLVMVSGVVEKDGALVSLPHLPSVLARCEMSLGLALLVWLVGGLITLMSGVDRILAGARTFPNVVTNMEIAKALQNDEDGIEQQTMQA